MLAQARSKHISQSLRSLVNQLSVAALLFGALPLLHSCSVGMALSGDREPNFAVLKRGASQGEIEAELGPPNTVATLEGGASKRTYEYQVGNEPSAGRAALHAGMDVLTLGIWELVGTPTEAMQGQRFEVAVTYGPDGTANEIQPRPLD
jgi:hypothetical protein